MSTFVRSLGGHGAWPPSGRSLHGLQSLPSSDGILVSGNSPLSEGKSLKPAGHADFVDLQVGSGAAR